MRRRRRRIVCRRRLTRLVVRALVIRLRRLIGYVRPRVHPLRRALDRTLGRGQRRTHWRSHVLSPHWRSHVLCPHWARRIVARQVRATRTRPLRRPRESAPQNCARSRRRAPGTGKCLRANVGPANRRDAASIPIQRLLMIRPGRCSVIERPRTLGRRSTIDDH
jgi:hypothetical protein